MTMQQQPRGRGWVWSPTGPVLLVFLAVAAFFVVTEHRAHAWGVLPFLLLLLCPVLHLFLHGRHGSSHHEGQHQRPEGNER